MSGVTLDFRAVDKAFSDEFVDPDPFEVAEARLALIAKLHRENGTVAEPVKDGE
jgi:hypothetical protein